MTGACICSGVIIGVGVGATPAVASGTDPTCPTVGKVGAGRVAMTMIRMMMRMAMPDPMPIAIFCPCVRDDMLNLKRGKNPLTLLLSRSTPQYVDGHEK